MMFDERKKRHCSLLGYAGIIMVRLRLDDVEKVVIENTTSQESLFF